MPPTDPTKLTQDELLQRLKENTEALVRAADSLRELDKPGSLPRNAAAKYELVGSIHRTIARIEEENELLASELKRRD
jgi:hypothetical protein